MKRVAVTGGAGFVGSHLVEKLLAEGSDVLVLDDFSTGREKNIEAVKQATGRAPQVVRCDIAEAACAQAIESFCPEIIFHVAAQANVRRSVQDPMFDARVNVIGTINLLEAGRRAGVKGFIFSSTGGAVYGEQDQFPADESHRTRPECPYGVSKRSGELYLEYFARTFGFSGVALRYSNVYGPRQNPKGEAGVVAVFAERLLKGESLVVNGDGEQTRDFVYVGDVVQANFLAGQAIVGGRISEPFSVFNVGCGEETSVNDIVENITTIWSELATNAGCPSPKVEVEFAAAPVGEQRRSVISAAKIQGQLGWRAKAKFNQGLRDTVQSFVAGPSASSCAAQEKSS